MWTGAILAGGRSRRLGGRNKAALQIGHATVLDRQLATLRPVVDRTIIVANDAASFAWTGLAEQPRCATTTRRCAEELARLIDEQRFKRSEVALIPGLIIRELGPNELEPFGPEERLFFNINTLDDYARAIDLDANS